MNSRTITTAGLSLFALALLIGCTGLVVSNDDLMRVGLLVSVPAGTVLIVGHQRREHAVNDDQLADAHRAGYQLALDHVARGLLDQHRAPNGPGKGDQLGGNVRRLYPHDNDDDERQVG